MTTEQTERVMLTLRPEQVPDGAGIYGLIADLIRAHAPSRELDLDIHLAVYPDGDVAKIVRQHPRGLGVEGYAWDIRGCAVIYEKWQDGRCPVNGGCVLPEYTSSIDAALKLMRKHYLWQLKQGIECTAIVWWLEKDWDDTGAPTASSTIYPALALATAALIARAVEDRGTPQDSLVLKNDERSEL